MKNETPVFIDYFFQYAAHFDLYEYSVFSNRWAFCERLICNNLGEVKKLIEEYGKDEYTKIVPISELSLNAMVASMAPAAKSEEKGKAV